MIEVLGIKYISEKEAANRFGYSTYWFTKERWKGTGPKYVRLQGRGKVLYKVDEIDNWFKDNMLECS